MLSFCCSASHTAMIFSRPSIQLFPFMVFADGVSVHIQMACLAESYEIGFIIIGVLMPSAFAIFMMHHEVTCRIFPSAFLTAVFVSCQDFLALAGEPSFFAFFLGPHEATLPKIPLPFLLSYFFGFLWVMGILVRVASGTKTFGHMLYPCFSAIYATFVFLGPHCYPPGLKQRARKRCFLWEKGWGTKREKKTCRALRSLLTPTPCRDSRRTFPLSVRT